MSQALLAIQALLSAFLIAVVVERARMLLFLAPAGPSFVEALSHEIDAGNGARVASLVRALPGCWVSRLVTMSDENELEHGVERIEIALADLRLEAQMRLPLLRVSATLSSTLGLLAGILAIQRGFSGKGLLSLSAGLAQQIALNEALTHMAIGMGTAAFCFAAFAIFRQASRVVLSQLAHIAARLRATGRAIRAT